DVLADEDSWYSRRDGMELTAYLARGIGLEVPDILVSRSTEQEDEDTRSRPPEVALPGEVRGRLGSLAEQVGQREAERTKAAGAQPFSPRHAFAQRYARARQRDHWHPPFTANSAPPS